MSKEIIHNHLGSIWVDKGNQFVVKANGRKYICLSHINNNDGSHTITSKPLSKWLLIRKYQVWKIRRKLKKQNHE